MQQETRLLYLDNLRALAIVGVVTIHVSGVLLYQFGALSAFDWWVGNIVDSAVRCSVPLFVMITGALLLQDDDGTIRFYRHRFMRLIPPFIFWALVYIIFNISGRIIHDTNFHPSQIPSLVWIQITKGISPHFWFIYLILGIYLLIPLLRRFIHYAGEQGVTVFLGVWFCLLLAWFAFPSIFIPGSY